MPKPLLLMICSPSGAGKTTLTRHLLTAIEGLAFSVSHTTRALRGQERDGEDYHFVDQATFRARIDAHRFAEWAEVHGNLYGTSLDELDRAEAAGKLGVLFDIDVQGARQIRASYPDAIGVFVLPPSMRELRQRLEGRGTDAPDVIERRFAKARDEIERYAFFDYLVVNDDLEEAKADMVAIVRAELLRQHRVAPRAEDLLRESRS